MNRQTIAKQYLERARSRGAIRGQMPQYHNFVDDSYRGLVQQPYMMATGDPATMVKPSLPYSIIVSSASAASVQNFDVFGASEYLNNPTVTFNANGDLVIGSVTISSNTVGVTYRDLLQQSAWQPFTVGQVYLQCTSPTSQILQPYTISTKDANGVRVQIPVKPKKDPYQQQNELLIDSTVWSLDGLSKLTFSQILPFAVLSLDFYPQANINSGRLLNGQAPGKDYGNPGIIRTNQTVIPAAGASNFAGGGHGGTIIRTRY